MPWRPSTRRRQQHQRDAAPTAVAPRLTLQHLLTEAGSYEPEYGPKDLTSHLPMALTALRRLGADVGRCRDYFGWYVQARRLQPLNRQSEFAGLARGIAASIGARGREAVLHEALPVLMQSPGSQAFHGLIRIAYAIEADNDDELAAALAYWQLRPLLLAAGDPDLANAMSIPMPIPMPIKDIFRAAETLYAPYRGSFHGLIVDTMQTVAALPGFGRLAASAPSDEAALDDLAALALALFASTGDFTALHALTGTHAFRLTSAYLDDRGAAVRALAVAILAAYADMNAPPLPDDDALDVLRRTPAPEWQELASRAILSNDDHVIKVTYSAREEDALRSDPLYRVAVHRYQQRH